jgi:hypothetical protein
VRIASAMVKTSCRGLHHSPADGVPSVCENG